MSACWGKPTGAEGMMFSARGPTGETLLPSCRRDWPLGSALEAAGVMAMTAEATLDKCARPFIGAGGELRGSSGTDRQGPTDALRQNQDILLRRLNALLAQLAELDAKDRSARAHTRLPLSRALELQGIPPSRHRAHGRGCSDRAIGAVRCVSCASWCACCGA